MPARCVIGALISLGAVPCAARGAFPQRPAFVQKDPPPAIPTLDDLAPPRQHRALVYPELATGDDPGMYAPDLTELILLAGQADGDGGLQKHSLDFLKSEAGWMFGTRLTHKEGQKKCYSDNVWAWRKGTHCIAAWSATDDLRDLTLSATAIDQANQKPNTTSYCGFDVNAFVAAEMEGFRRSPGWGDFVAYFAREECETVSSVGHSLGGAMATVFAGCANVRADGFGGRSDFGLVTFGAHPVSLEPIYSGTPGTPFVGTRYHVAATGDARGPLEKKMYRMDMLYLFRELALLLGMHQLSVYIVLHISVFEKLFPSMGEGYWAEKGLDEQLYPFLGIATLLGKGIFPNDLPGNATPEAFMQGRRTYTTFMRKIIARGDAFFDFDPVSSFNQIYGYTHALVDFQPVANHLHGSVPLARVPAENATLLPGDDPFRVLFGLQASGKLPNHFSCCYYRGKNCPYLYAKTAMRSKACVTTLTR